MASVNTKYEIVSFELEIRSLRAQKSHLRRWINKGKGALQPYSWELPDIAAARIASHEKALAHYELKIAKLDDEIAGWKDEIAKLKAGQA